MISVKSTTGSIKHLEDVTRSLSAPPHAIVLRIAPDQQRKLDLFTAQRDILQMTPVAQTSVNSAVRDEVSVSIARGSRTPLADGAVAGAQELKRLYTDRFLKSGGDVTLKALSRAWATRKRRRGLDPRIGYATGALARAIAQSTIVVR